MAGKRPFKLPRGPINAPLSADVTRLDPSVRGGKAPSGSRTEETGEDFSATLPDNTDTLGFEGDDFEGDSFEAEAERYGKRPAAPLTERIISGAITALTMLLLGGSVVFWWVLLRHLVRSPYSLADPALMRLLLLSCALCPLAVTVAQKLLRRPQSMERWLICMCIGGLLATLIITFTKLVLWHEPFTFADLPVMICCAVSGCALPSALYMGIRLLLERIAARSAARSGDWEQVKRDVSALSDFDL